MSAVDHYILGNDALYARLCLITEILGKFVSSAPRTVNAAQLESETGRPARELVKLCGLLCREQLLHPHPKQRHTWLLACEASTVTLEDAFRCMVAEQALRTSARQKSVAGKTGDDPDGGSRRSGARREVDLLVMQAAMGINQSVFQLLRQFSLDRLKVSAAGMFPSGRPLPDTWPRARLSFS